VLPAYDRRLRFLACVLAAGLLAYTATAQGRTEIPSAAQPQLAVAEDGRVWLVYGHGNDIFVALSMDGGGTFPPAVNAASPAKLMLGMRRGPRIAARGDTVTVTFVADELRAVHSRDGGRTWSAPVAINDAPQSAREGLHDLAVAPDGRRFVTWLDLRQGKMELWSAESADAGATWSPNERVYASPDKSICECCHPSALFDAEGNLAVMWRNSIAGHRDMWLTTRAKGATKFTPAVRLGQGTWTLNACPMDGGRIIALGGGKFAAVWQRAGEVFYSPAEGAEVSLGKGKQPVALSRGTGLQLFWQQGTDLVSSRHPASGIPVTIGSDARFPVVVSTWRNEGALLAYERGPMKEPVVIVQRLP